MARLAESLNTSGAEVEILSLNPRKHYASLAAAPLAAMAIDVDTSRLLVPALRAVSHHLPYLVARFYSSELQRALSATLRRFQPDVVQLESPFLLPYLEVVRAAASGARVVLRSLNVEFRIWEGLARSERNPFRRFALQRLASAMRRYEVGQLDRPDAIVPITKADADDFRGLGCTRPIHVAPCGMPLPLLSAEEPQRGTVGFIGSLDFRPNQDAVRWIIDDLWPRVAKSAPEARLSIAGSSPPEWLLRHAAGRGITIAADVADAQALVRRMSIVIAPLFAGGGMRIKVLEAMALAKPIVATSIGAGGIEVTPGRDLIIADDAASFADAVVRLLRDGELRSRMGDTARSTVTERYDAGTIARELVAFYRSLQ